MTSPISKPEEWSEYECEGYFRDGWAAKGYYDPDAYLWLVVKLSDAYLNAEVGFLVIGHFGTDGIDFGYRKHRPGIWAFSPMEWGFTYVAAEMDGLIQKWHADEIIV